MKFKVGDRVRAITGEEGDAYDKQFWNARGTVMAIEGTHYRVTYRVTFDNIANPSSGNAWICREAGIVDATNDILEEELTAALSPLFQRKVATSEKSS